MNPLKQSQNFYNGFVKYALKKEKELKNFKLILNYVEDIETFLLVINSNIEEIFQRYDELKTNPIKMTASLKLVKKKIENLKKICKIEKEKKIKEDSDDEGDISDEDDRKGVIISPPTFMWIICCCQQMTCSWLEIICWQQQIISRQK